MIGAVVGSAAALLVSAGALIPGCTPVESDPPVVKSVLITEGDPVVFDVSPPTRLDMTMLNQIIEGRGPRERCLTSGGTPRPTGDVIRCEGIDY